MEHQVLATFLPSEQDNAISSVEPLENRLAHNRTPVSGIMCSRKRSLILKRNKYLSLHYVKAVEIMKVECISKTERKETKIF